MTTGSDYPYRFERTTTIGPLRERHSDLEAGTDAGRQVRVAGRVMTVRGHGKVGFADLVDSTGRIQLFAQLDVLGEEGMEAFARIGVGDIVGIEGEVAMTRRGELSVKVAGTTMLARCQRPLPEKWHGMSDVEVRYRQRYLDLISNEVPRAVLVARAKVNQAIRRFFDDRGFIEVETPLLQPIAGGAVARPFVTHHNALDIDLHLRIAPELYLKRLLIGGAEKVYELNRSFRNEGVSTRHNPEFTMLEAYEAFVDYEDTMALVEALVLSIAAAVGSDKVKGPFRRMTMFEGITEATDRDLETPWRAGDEQAIRTAADELGVRTEPGWSAGKVLFEIYEMRVEKELIAPTFIMGMPKDVSPLAKDHRCLLYHI
jgi:lysyl-tRNA synthetase class 2